MAIVSSSSYFASNTYKYDVFISFRGDDTRKNFTSHLYAALRRSSIETYIDERSLERGEEISPSLLKAIEESQLSLVVFSQNYASSRWCLDELVHILKCKKENGQIVIPLFYHVDPSNIRHQRGSFGDAFVAHHKRFKHDRNKVEVWRNALKEAVNLSGFDSKDESEAEFVEKIVKDVREKLKIISSIATANDFKGLVGMTKCFHEMDLSLSLGSPNVRIVGIWGMGGIGKTTLAKALCKRFSSIFDSCFFTDVKEKLFYELLKEGQLRRKKVFVVLDNVNDLQQLEDLLQIHDIPRDFCRWFGVGSRIIITSRDKKLLNDIGADKIYEVKALNSYEAHKLLCKKAFQCDSARSGYEELAERVLNYAQGHPLAIEILGSYLYGRSKEEWESTLSKLKKYPDKRIHNVMKLSFLALDRMEKSIFLDIACFFNGKERNFLESIHGDGAHIGISVLIERSLITVTGYYKTIGMHGLIEEMGREIAGQEGSRFWITNDVLKVLENKKGNDKIEGISLNMSEIDEDLCLEPTVFQEMCNLRLLMIHIPQYLYQRQSDRSFHNFGEKYSKVKLDQGLSCLPNSLRYLHWYHYPLKTFPPKFRPKCLVQLEMPNSQLTHPWNGVQPLGNLKHIDLRFSFKLVEIPDLTIATRLETINMHSCRSLIELPPIKLHNFDNGVQPLENLSHVSRPESADPQDSKISVEVSSQLFSIFANEMLGNLDFSKCTNLKILSELSGNIRILNLSRTKIKELPSSIRSCESLLELNLSGCFDLEIFPKLPRNIEDLDLSFTSIREMPAASIECLHRVKRIDMRHCNLESLPPNFSKLKALIELDLTGCSNLKSFPEISEPMENLCYLFLSMTGIQELPTSFENLFGLKELKMVECINLKTIPEDLGKLSCLSSLTFSACWKLESFPNMLLGLSSLKELNLNFCNIFEIPSWIGYLTSLTKINLSGNMFASIPPGIKHLPKLVELDIRDCMNLRSLPELPLSVDTLIANGCVSIEAVLETSTSTFAQGCLDDVAFSGSRYPKFMFCGCLKLNQNACNKIAIDFLCRIAYFCRKKGRMIAPQIELCYPGNRIPEWIRHQSEGFSKLTIKIPPNWHSSKFSGFVACIVLSFEELLLCVRDDLDICCTVNFKTKNGQSHCYGTFRCFLSVKQQLIEGKICVSDHVFMWYVGDGIYYYDEVEMSVDFFCGRSSKENRGGYSSKYEVKSCGVHMLCYIEEEVIKKNNMDIKQSMDDTEQLGITMHQHIQLLQDANHGIVVETPSDNDDRNTAGSSQDSTMNHEETVNLNFPPSLFDSDDDQINNIVEGNSDAVENIPEPSAAPVINFDAGESCYETIKCFDFCSW